MSRHTPRDWRYRKLTRKVRDEEQICWLCGRPIDPSAPARTPWSWTLDHVTPISRGGDPYARTNARAAHLLCNQRRGTGRPTRTTTTQPLRTSRAW